MLEPKRLEQYLALLALLLLCIGSLLVVRPFLSALLLALILTISTWPLYEYTVKALKGRKTLAAAIVTLGLASALIVPLVFLFSSLGNEVTALRDMLRPVLEDGARLPTPFWLKSIPLIGDRIAIWWETVSLNTSEIVNRLRPYFSEMTSAVVSIAATLGSVILELCVALIISFLLFRDAQNLAAKLRTVMTKLAGTRSEGLIRTAGFTLKSVVYGILGTAIIQGLLATVGFLIAGVPGAALLGFFTCILSLVPVGPPLIWIPACIWLYSQGQTAMTVFLALWGAIAVSGSDNIIKPYLISKGSNLPLILIFVGVLGGVLHFGFLGVFLGPTLLALLYSLVKEWISQPASDARIVT